MKHPIYRNDNEIYIETAKRLKNKGTLSNFLNKVSISLGISRKHKDMQLTTIIGMIFRDIMDNGHNVINIKNSDWESDITKETINKLKLSDINFAINAGTIITDNLEMHFSVFTKEKLEYYDAIHPGTFSVGSIEHPKVLQIVAIDKKDKDLFNVFIIVDDLIQKTCSNEERDMLTIFYSVLLYFSTFKTVKSRVDYKKVACKKSAKRSIPKHTTNVIKLTQYVKEYIRPSSNEPRNKSDKRWLVRGHWRNQYYKTIKEYKPKWIDPYWKGTGKEEINKIYKIGKQL